MKQEKLLIHRIYFFLVIVLMTSCQSLAQSTKHEKETITQDSLTVVEYTLLGTIQVEGKQVATDPLQQIYVVTSHNDLIKYSPKGKELYRYSNYELGDISQIDVSNPFNVLVFYEAYQTVEILDRTLNLTASFDLYQAESPNINLVAISKDQQIWVYDALNFQLKKLNTKGEILLESNNLSTIISSDYSLNFLSETNGKIYLGGKNQALYQFDIFGNFIQKSSFEIPSAQIQILQGSVIYSKNNNVCIQNLDIVNQNITQFKLPKTEEKILQTTIQKQNLILLEKKQVKLYHFKLKLFKD